MIFFFPGFNFINAFPKRNLLVTNFYFHPIWNFSLDPLDHTGTTVSNASKCYHCLYYSIKGGVVKPPGGDLA